MERAADIMMMARPATMLAPKRQRAWVHWDCAAGGAFLRSSWRRLRLRESRDEDRRPDRGELHKLSQP